MDVATSISSRNLALRIIRVSPVFQFHCHSEEAIRTFFGGVNAAEEHPFRCCAAKINVELAAQERTNLTLVSIIILAIPNRDPEVEVGSLKSAGPCRGLRVVRVVIRFEIAPSRF